MFFSLFSGRGHTCPECGSDHVVQIADQSTPPYSSTPIYSQSRPDVEDDLLDGTHTSRSANKVFFVIN